jgi:tRNA (guanine-N7-)-methyltransferase
LANRTPPPIRYQEMSPKLPAEGEIRLPDLASGDGPLELDVGYGRGASLFSRAAASPESRILGIELKAKWAFKVDERAKRLGLERVRAFHGDARDALSRAVPDACLDAVFLYFPDPWWKKRHTKRRVLGDAVADHVARLLRPAGAFFIQTDVEDRARLYRDLLRAHPAFTLEGDDGFVAHNPFGSVSNRELRAEEDGLPVYRVVARRG